MYKIRKDSDPANSSSGSNERQAEKTPSQSFFPSPSSSSKHETLIKYTLLPSIPLCIITILSANPHTWVTSGIHHFYIELLGVIFAIVLAFYYITRAYTLDDKFSLFIGVGFLANALIDLLHVVVSLSLMNEPLFLKYFIPQTWFAGRIFLSAMLAIAIAGYPIFSNGTTTTSSISRQHQQKLRETLLRSNLSTSPPSSKTEETGGAEKELGHLQLNRLPKLHVTSLVILAVVSAGVSISSFFTDFPGAVIDNFALHRPYEIMPLVFFLVALFYFYKNQLYKLDDVLFKAILVSLVIDSFGQIIMSYSATSFDTAHNVAHVLKDAGYFVNIIGLVLSSINYNSRLSESNSRLKEREELIRAQYLRLKESEKMKSEFINVASHELRTPIQPILGLSVILRPKIQDKQQREYLDIVIRNAKRLLRLTEAILDVTKIESKSLMIKKERFDLKEKIQNVINDIASQARDNNPNVKISFIEPKDPIYVEADKSRIYQVISNILTNAIKFTKEGTISVTAEKKDHNSVVVGIKDNGPGIDPIVMQQLFTKFTTKSPSNDTQTGTGLGLYICKSIVEAHGGMIWAENKESSRSGDNSDAERRGGATFYFSIPTIVN
jgi:signal transduction histidine kinase